MLNFEFEKKLGEQSISVKGALKDDVFGISIDDTIFSDASLKMTGNISDINNIFNKNNDTLMIDETKLIPAKISEPKNNKKKSHGTKTKKKKS